MTGADRIDPRQVQGLKRLKHVLPLLASPHQVGCERDKAGNRELHFTALHCTSTSTSPWSCCGCSTPCPRMLDSVRALQKAGGLEKVSEQLGVNGSEWASSGSASAPSSFSESVRVFDPGKLKAVVQQLAGELQGQGQFKPVNADPRLKQHLGGKPLTMADGTVLTVPGAIATVAQATWLRFRDGTAKHAWKLHVQLDFDTLLPDVDAVELTDARNSGDSEAATVTRRRSSASTSGGTAATSPIAGSGSSRSSTTSTASAAATSAG